jgi:hypothetical protein
MSLWSKIIGTINTRFQIGLGGPNWNANAGNLEAQNASVSGFVIVRGATPVAANDLATKAYVDSGSVVEDGGLQVIRFAVTTASAQNSVTSIPAGALVFDAFLDVQTGFSAGTTITIGNAGSPALLLGTADNLATAIGIYDVPQDTSWGGSPATVLVTVAGSPSVGSAFAVVKYVQAAQP